MKKYIETYKMFIINEEKQYSRFEDWVDNTIDIEIINMKNEYIMINNQMNMVLKVKYRKYSD